MSQAMITGTGMTTFERASSQTVKDLVGRAVREALQDAGLQAGDVDTVVFANALGGLLQGQECVRGQVWLEQTGLQGRPIFNVENACASGGTALHWAWLQVQSGHVETSLVVGAEKLSHPDRARPLQAMTGALDQDRLPDAGSTEGSGRSRSAFMDIYAGLADTYAEASGATGEDFAHVAVKTHAHGALNPRAQYRRAFTVDEVLAARAVAGQLTVPMCAPIGDGAAAVVVTSAERAARLDCDAVKLLTVAVGSSVPGRNGRLVAETSGRAYATAGLGPEDVDVLEVHDAASPAELIAVEELAIAEAGGALRLLHDGDLGLGGRWPTNTSGGLVSKGHPLGATGVAQVVELADQLRDRSGPRQVPDARVGLAENAGGFLGPEPAAATVALLAR